jgi:glutamate-1-semialdehyde 2,1-aminomutase
VPGGGHTYSKGDDQFPLNAPQAFVRGKGARVWDLDGRVFVDWGMGINSVLIGHAEDAIDDAAVAALRNGQNFSRPTPREVETAEAVTALFPGMHMAKFAKNGSDANTGAVRLARAITGRQKIAFDGDAPFLAIHDWFIGNTVMNAGVPAAVSQFCLAFHYNDLASVEELFAEHGAELAAVILEPCREVRPAPGFLEEIRDLCDTYGALLIFDEVVTGFRYGLHGVYELLGVTPDLLSLGKGMANGYALTALLGRREYMERGGIRHSEERVFLLSTTNGAEQSALAAGIATIAFYQEHDVIGHLAAVGQALVDGLRAAASRHGVSEYVSIRADFPCRPTFTFLDANHQPSAEHRTLFMQELLRHGVFMPWICPSYRHGSDEIAQTLEALDAACAVHARAIAQGSVDGLLDGPAAKPVFRRYN